MNGDDRPSRPTDMSDADFDLIERFITAFNRVDRYLRDLYKADERMSFGRLVEIHLRKNPRWRDADSLRAFKAVRNVMIHERELPYRYLFVPTRSAVEEMERICSHLIQPERLLPKFQRKVRTVQAADTAAELFALVSQYNYTKFPVYEGARFRGLLTENGLTRWMARCATTLGGSIAPAEIRVATILDQEEDGRNVEFMAGDCPTDDLLRSFSTNENLRAVLVTAHGVDTEPLLGIATWGDALRLL